MKLCHHTDKNKPPPGQEEKADLSEIGRKVDLLMKACYLEGQIMMRRKIEEVFMESEPREE